MCVPYYKEARAIHRHTFTISFIYSFIHSTFYIMEFKLPLSRHTLFSSRNCCCMLFFFTGAFVARIKSLFASSNVQIKTDDFIQIAIQFQLAELRTIFFSFQKLLFAA